MHESRSALTCARIVWSLTGSTSGSAVRRCALDTSTSGPAGAVGVGSPTAAAPAKDLGSTVVSNAEADGVVARCVALGCSWLPDSPGGVPGRVPAGVAATAGAEVATCRAAGAGLVPACWAMAVATAVRRGDAVAAVTVPATTWSPPRKIPWLRASPVVATAPGSWGPALSAAVVAAPVAGAPEATVRVLVPGLPAVANVVPRMVLEPPLGYAPSRLITTSESRSAIEGAGVASAMSLLVAETS